MAQILLIEPDRLLARSYQAALESVGHRVQVAGEAQAAIDAADACSPDIVVAELMLGGHNGVEFLYEFRSYAEWQATPVIINTSVPPAEWSLARALWQQLGIVAYHYKPRTTLRQLLRSVDEMITRPA